VNCGFLGTNLIGRGIRVFGTSGVSLDVLLLFAAVLAADREEIGVGAGAVYQIDCVVIQDEFC
jgi:hypothetical protein